VGGVVLPAVVAVLRILLNVHEIPAIVEDRDVPADYGKDAIAFLAKGKFKSVGVAVLTQQFQWYWAWARKNYQQFMGHKGDQNVFDHKAMFAHLLTTKTQGTDAFFEVKGIMDFNNSVAWMSCETERTGKKINDLLENAPNLGDGSLYDRLIIIGNLPHYTQLDYQFIIAEWLRQGKRNAVTKKGGESQVMARIAATATKKNSILLNKRFAAPVPQRDVNEFEQREEMEVEEVHASPGGSGSGVVALGQGGHGIYFLIVVECFVECFLC
jgi:hypothetical protein